MWKKAKGTNQNWGDEALARTGIYMNCLGSGSVKLIALFFTATGV